MLIEYSLFMDNLLDKGYLQVTSDDVAAWYIPHFGIYHPHKRKIRVVFDCSAELFGTSLNDNLM